MNILITGANRGLGLEFCRQYLTQGDRVIACCRAPGQATQLLALQKQFPALVIEQLDIVNESEVQQLSEKYHDLALDCLINNVGYYGQTPQSLENCEQQDWLNTVQVNAIAPILLTRALLPSLKKATSAKVAFLTSKMGSIGDNGSGRSYIYRSSKAALNAAIKSLAIDYVDEGLSVIALHPGWVRTDMGGPNGLIEPEESITGLRNVIAELDSNSSGSFKDYQGKSIVW